MTENTGKKRFIGTVLIAAIIALLVGLVLIFGYSYFRDRALKEAFRQSTVTVARSDDGKIRLEVVAASPQDCLLLKRGLSQNPELSAVDGASCGTVPSQLLLILN